MTCGIYTLNFKNTNQVYVGQSMNIEARYYNHIWSLRNNNASKKMQEAFNTYGIPTINIILECDSSELDSAEIEAIELYDSINNGFNTCVGGGEFPILRGEDHPNSKYSKEQILYIFESLISDNPPTHLELSELTGMDISSISHISTGQTHKWLQDIYGEEYNTFISRPKKVRDAKSLGKKYPMLIDTEGNTHSVDNTHHFAKLHGFDQGNLHKLLTGKIKSSKGWKVYGGQ